MDMMMPYCQDNYVTLYHGDCQESSEWLEADVIVTDPPYGYNHASGREGIYQNQAIANDQDLAARDSVLKVWGSKPALVFGSWKMPRPEKTHTLLVWDKGPASGMGDLSIPWKPNTEEIYVVGKGFQGKRTTSVLSGHTVTTWASNGRLHPNMKPTSLMEYLIN